MIHLNVYLAAPIFNPHQLEVVSMMKREIEEADHAVFSPYHESRDIWNGRAPKDCTPAERRSVVFQNVRRLDWAHCVLAWVGGYPEGFTDPGVLWELGYAGCRSGVPAIETSLPRVPFSVGFIHDSDTRRGMNLMLAGTLDYGVKGEGELGVFLRHLADLSDSAIDAHTLKEMYRPENVLMHEEGKIS